VHFEITAEWSPYLWGGQKTKIKKVPRKMADIKLRTHKLGTNAPLCGNPKLLHFCPFGARPAILLTLQNSSVCGVHNLIPAMYLVGSTWTFFGFFLPTFWVFFSHPVDCSKDQICGEEGVEYSRVTINPSPPLIYSLDSFVTHIKRVPKYWLFFEPKQSKNNEL